MALTSSRCLLRIQPQGLPWAPQPLSSSLPEIAVSSLPHLTEQRRYLRHRLIQSAASKKSFTIDNPVTSKTWPPLDQWGGPVTPHGCRELLHHLHMQEAKRMRKLRSFEMPKMQPGDLVEVRYELCRTQQTFAVFQGYCVEVRKKRLNSSFILKNTYEGVGVEQLIPRYSPRLLDVRVIKPINNPVTMSNVDLKPITRCYRYKWHRNIRMKMSAKEGVHRPGIRSVENKIRSRILRIRRRYHRRRIESGLPPYVWGGPYPQYYRPRTKMVRAETWRRIKIYEYDEMSRRSQKLTKRRLKEKWGVYRIHREPRTTAITALPSYHPLNPGNLPK